MGDCLTRKNKKHTKKQPFKPNAKEASENFIKSSVGVAITNSMGDSYLSAYALALGATDSFIGQLSAIPSLISSTLQLLLAKRFKSRKNVIFIGILLTFLIWIGILSLSLYPVESALQLLLVYVIVYSSINAILAPIWASWVGDYLRKSSMGSFFGKRDAIVSTLSAVGSLLAGYLLSISKSSGNQWIGFLLIFSLAALGRLISLYFLNKIPDVKPSYEKQRKIRKRSILWDREHQKVRTFLLYSSVLFIAVTIASPFFVVYKLRILELTYLQYGILILIGAISRYFSSRYWGYMIDRYNSKDVTLAGGIIIALHLFIYVYFPEFKYLILAEMLSGFGWSAHDVGGFTYIMTHSNRETRASYVSYYNFLFGITRFIGTNIGLILIDRFNVYPFLGISGIPGVILFSGVLRLIVAVMFIPLLKDHGMRQEGKLIVAMLTEYPIRTVSHLIFHHHHYSHHTIKHIG